MKYTFHICFYSYATNDIYLKEKQFSDIWDVIVMISRQKNVELIIENCKP